MEEKKIEMKRKTGKGPSIFVVCGDLSDGTVTEIEKVHGI